MECWKSSILWLWSRRHFSNWIELELTKLWQAYGTHNQLILGNGFLHGIERHLFCRTLTFRVCETLSCVVRHAASDNGIHDNRRYECLIGGKDEGLYDCANDDVGMLIRNDRRMVQSCLLGEAVDELWVGWIPIVAILALSSLPCASCMNSSLICGSHNFRDQQQGWHVVHTFFHQERTQTQPGHDDMLVGARKNHALATKLMTDITVTPMNESK